MTRAARVEDAGAAPRRNAEGMMKGMRDALCVMAAALLAAAALCAHALPDAAAADRPVPGKRLVTLEFRDVELSAFLVRMGEITGVNIVFDERVTGRITVFPARRLAVGQALAFMKSVLEYRGYAVVEKGGFLEVLPVADAVRKNGNIIMDMSR